MSTLTGAQVKYLRGLAHPLKPIVIVGDEGLKDALFSAVDEALDQHELIKVRLRKPENKKAMAKELTERCTAVLVGLVGHTVILYRRHPKKPKIHLPAVP